MKKLFHKLALLAAVIGLALFAVPCKTAMAKPEDSFVQILFDVNSDMIQAGGSGSGAVIKKVKNGGYVLTAAHVCLAGVYGYKLPAPMDLMYIEIRVLDKDLNFYSGEVFGFDLDKDLCLVYVEGIDLPAIEIASRPPRSHEKAINVAAPLGIFGDDLMPYFEGHYLGTIYDSWVDVMESNKTAVYSIPAAGGSSGSPVLNRYGRLIGMIHSVYPAMHHLSLSPTWKQIDSFLKRQLGDF